MFCSLGKYLASEKAGNVRVDGVNDGGKWKNVAGKKLKSPFPTSLDFSKDEGDGFSLTWNSDKDKLLGNLAKNDESAYVCIETCGYPTMTTVAATIPVQASATCGAGWVELKDGTCIM